VWTGPLAAALGSIDLSVPVSLIVTPAVYIALQRLSVKRRPKKDPAANPYPVKEETAA
jgi:hypothetical protein